MTTPRVTVPVEPTPKMLAATWDHEIDKSGGIESQNARNARIWAAMLSAAPAPEGGAVSERLAEIATWTDEEWETVFAHRPDLRDRMRAALATRSDDKPEGGAVSGCKGCGCAPMEHHADWCPSLKGGNGPLSTREEAPAEAGEAFRRLSVSAHSNSSCPGWTIVSQNDLRVALSALRAQPPASPSTLAELHAAERLIDQQDAEIRRLKAREDAQPDAGARLAKAMWGVDLVPAANPAPDALRVAVEALEPFAMAARGLSSRWGDQETHWQGATSPIAVEDLRRADQALAALQAEQKGGA